MSYAGEPGQRRLLLHAYAAADDVGQPVAEVIRLAELAAQLYVDEALLSTSTHPLDPVHFDAIASCPVP